MINPAKRDRSCPITALAASHVDRAALLQLDDTVGQADASVLPVSSRLGSDLAEVPGRRRLCRPGQQSRTAPSDLDSTVAGSSPSSRMTLQTFSGTVPNRPWVPITSS